MAERDWLQGQADLGTDPGFAVGLGEALPGSDSLRVPPAQEYPQGGVRIESAHLRKLRSGACPVLMLTLY